MAGKRKPGDGTVRHRKSDDRWEGRVVIGYDEKGLPKTKTVTAKTKTECEKKLKKLKESLGEVKEKNTSEMAFGKWMDFWYKTYCKPKLRPYTQTTYEQRIYKQIIPKIGDTPLNKVTTGLLDRFYAQLKVDGRLVKREIYGTGLTNSVVRSIHAHCRAALEKAVKEGLIKQNPAKHCKLPPKKSAEIEVLTPAEMQRLLIQAKEEGFYELFLLALATGMRRGELLALQWDDINFKKCELKITKQVRFEKKELIIGPPKTKAANRTIVLPKSVIEVLKEYRKKVRSKWLFPSPHKSEDLPRDPCACRKKLATILEHANCKHVPFHALRHTFATQALRYGMDVKTLATTIGHESVETTLNVYSHATDEGLRSAALRIDRAMGAISGVEDNGEPVEAKPAKPEKPPREKFEPYKGKKRKNGTGYVTQVSKNCWQGRYTPTVNGVRIARNIYAPTKDECERKLAELIKQMQEEIAEMKNEDTSISDNAMTIC